MIVAPAASAMRSASRLTDTGSAMRAPGTTSLTRLTSASSACSLVSVVPWSSTIVAHLALGVEHEAEVGARRAHEVAHRLQARLEVVARRGDPERSWRTGSRPSTDAPILGSTFGITNDTAPNE